MAAATRATAKIDWVRIGNALGLKGQTAAALQAFKKRNDDAKRKIMQLRAQPTSVDFASYRATLGNQAIVDEIESHVHAFKPKTYDVGRQIKAIETFEVQAVQSAQETKAKVDAEVADLTKALKDISETRPWDQITVEEVMQACPDVEKRVEWLVSQHRWMVPGYQEKFGNLSVL